MMKNLISTFFLSMVIMVSTDSNAQMISNGKSLAESCQLALTAVDRGLEHLDPEKHADAFICFSYLSGILGAARFTEELSQLRYAVATDGKGDLRKFKNYCIDWNIQYQKAARIILNFIRQNPTELNEPAHATTLRALTSAYPCP